MDCPGIGSPGANFFSVQNVEPLQYESVYYHDYHGWRDVQTETVEAFNAFIASQDDIIEAVNFFTAVDNVDYTVKIYDNFTGGSLSDELISQSGTLEYTGLHTITLDLDVVIAEGDDFYVYLSLSDGGHPYDRTSVVPVLLGSDSKTLVESAANPGESYYMTAKGWDDFYNYDDPSGYQNTGNFCIKALAVADIVGLNENNLQDNGFMLHQNAPNPFSSTTNIKYALTNKAFVQLYILDLNGRLVEKVVDTYQEAGEHNVNWNAGSLDNGVYIYKLIVDGQSSSGRMILMH